MCGIWGHITNEIFSAKESMNYYEAFTNVKARGPDNSTLLELNDFMNSFIGFHRLSIMDTDNKANQPFKFFETKTKSVYMTCNGEIYNYKKLLKQENFTPESKSDCEVIMLLYKKYGLEKMLDMIDGEFAIALIELEKGKSVSVHLCRDHMGIRPLYYAFDEKTRELLWSSDLKGTTAKSGNVEEAFQIVANSQHVLPGHRTSFIWTLEEVTKKISVERSKRQFFEYSNIPFTITDIEEAKQAINKGLKTAVIDRLMTDRPLGSLLSGGLDSSLVSAIAAKHYNNEGRRLRTFSVGMPGATDRKYAEMVAKHIDSDHKHVEFSEKDFLEAIELTVWTIGSFDITTIRASVGLVLISKWIRENTDIKILLTGEGSDELTSGYMYFHNAPNPTESHAENLRLLSELYIYDLLRGDRSIASFGLEGRIPFLDRGFMQTYLSISPELRIPSADKDFPTKIEKCLLRASFSAEKLLPYEALWRKKEAFSDGVSGEKRSWFEIIQEHAQKLYSDKDFESKKKEYTHMTPVNKESLYFREIYEKFYGKNLDNIVPHFWLPKWSGEVTEPSARILGAYKRNESE